MVFPPGNFDEVKKLDPAIVRYLKDALFQLGHYRLRQSGDDWNTIVTEAKKVPC